MSDEDLTLDTDRPDLLERGADGDPLPQGTRMIEKESLERVIEGLKIAADAASRLERMESEHSYYWLKLRLRIDGSRKIACGLAGFGSAPFKETAPSWGGEVGGWRKARMDFRDGIKQAAGGARQMATCHRGDLAWSKMAGALEGMQSKLNKITNRTVRAAQAQGKFWVPESEATRH